MRRAAGRLEPQHEQADQAADPDEPAVEVRPVEERATSARGEVCAAWPASPGTSSTAPAASERAAEREQLRDRALLAARAGRPRARRAPASAKSANVSSRSTKPRPNDDARISGTSAPTSQTRAQRELRRREQRVDRRRDERDRARDARTRPRRRAASSRSTRRTTGRAIADPQHEQPDRRHHRRGTRASARRAAAASRRSPRSTG